MNPTILLAERNFSEKARKILRRAGRVVSLISPAQFLKNLKIADVVVTGLEMKFLKPLLDKARHLKLIGSRTTQLRYIDLKECARRGIKVVNIKADAPALRQTASTAEETIGLLLALVRRIPWAMRSVERGKWERGKYGGQELRGKTIGLIGFGRLARMVAGYSQAFGMKVTAHDPYVAAEVMKKFQVSKATLERLLRQSDIVSLHVIYNEKTFGLLQRKHFQMMKPTAFFLNTARGEITDETALREALKKRWIAGAAIDTLANESPDGSHLRGNHLVKYARGHENLIVVPHLGGATREATERTQYYIAELVAKEIRSWRK